MNIPKEIIVKAIEGGFEWRISFEQSDVDEWWPNIALSPTFWQALGKAGNWDEGGLTDEGYKEAPLMWNMWQYQAHKFYDLILTGGDVTKFWEELLK